jgi:hypothetical protein
MPKSTTNRGVTLAAQKRFDEAIASCSRTLSARLAYGEAPDHRRKCLMRAGRCGAATTDRVALLTNDPIGNTRLVIASTRMHWRTRSSDYVCLAEELHAGHAGCAPFPLLARVHHLQRARQRG